MKGDGYCWEFHSLCDFEEGTGRAQCHFPGIALENDEGAFSFYPNWERLLQALGKPRKA